MAYKSKAFNKRLVESEIGTIRKEPNGRTKIVLVYPHTYQVGMSNLGFQTLYQLLNDIDQVVCERAFLPPKDPGATVKPTTIESNRPLSAFDIIAFSISFENDYPSLLTILENAGIPLLSADRSPHHPLVIAGGVACFLNPEPISPFIDCFLIGEAEPVLHRFFEVYEPKMERQSSLKILAREVDGVYVPSLYHVDYSKDKTIELYEPLADIPVKVRRLYVEDLSEVSTTSSIITPETVFGRIFLIEVGRGCSHGCRFCSAGYVYRPPRFRPLSQLSASLKNGMSITNRIGLVGTAVTDYPHLKELCSQVTGSKIRVSFSSFRVDRLSPEVISVLRQSGVKTATIAPDAGSQRMRNVIKKGITEESILLAVDSLVANGVPNLKLYFMIGLPTETEDDIEAVVKLCQRIKQIFLQSSRMRRHMGTITVSLNPFVPKPFTPFQWASMDEVHVLKTKIRKIKEGLKKTANVRVHAENPKQSFVQSLLSRGDRRVAEILMLLNQNRNNWAKTLKETRIKPDFYALRERPFDEVLPWQYIDHGLDTAFLKREFKRAILNDQ